MRVYVPSTMAGLARVFLEGGLGSPPLRAFAVTPSMREARPGAGEEELEYAAMTEAADASLALLTPQHRPRRVVIAADVAERDARHEAGISRSAVVVDAAVPLSEVAAVHVDDASAEPVVHAAVVVLADQGGADDTGAVSAVHELELQWYATQEIPDLLD